MLSPKQQNDRTRNKDRGVRPHDNTDEKYKGEVVDDPSSKNEQHQNSQKG
jgi:hypothetical protein